MSERVRRLMLIEQIQSMCRTIADERGCELVKAEPETHDGKDGLLVCFKGPRLFACNVLTWDGHPLSGRRRAKWHKDPYRLIREHCERTAIASLPTETVLGEARKRNGCIEECISIDHATGEETWRFVRRDSDA